MGITADINSNARAALARAGQYLIGLGTAPQRRAKAKPSVEVVRGAEQRAAQGLVHAAADSVAAVRSAPGPAAPLVDGAGKPYPRYIKRKGTLKPAVNEALFGRRYSVGSPYTLHPGLSATLEDIGSIHREIESTGWNLRKADLDSDMLRGNGVLQSLDRARRNAIYRAKLRLKPRNGTDLARKVCAFTRQVLEDTDGFLSSEGEMLAANARGTQLMDLIWHTPKDVAVPVGKSTYDTIRGAYALRSLEPIPARRVYFDPVSGEALLPVPEQVDETTERVNPFVYEDGSPTHMVMQHKAAGDGSARLRGYMFAASPIVWAMGLSLERWLKIFDLCAVATPYAILDPEKADTDEDAGAITDALQDLGLGIPALFTDRVKEIGFTRMPDGVTSDGIHGAILAYCESLLARLVNMQTLTGSAPTGSASYALGAVHQASEEAGQYMDLVLTSETHETQLVYYIVHINREALARALARWEPSDDALKLLADRAADARAGQEYLDVFHIEDARTWDPTTLWSRLTSASPDRLKIPLGRNPTTGKTVFLDLKEGAEGGMGPHGMMTGMTGSGKSETLLQFALSMAMLDELDAALTRAEAEASAVVLTGRPEHITLRQLHQLFVLPPLTTRSTSAVAQELKRRLAPAYAALVRGNWLAANALIVAEQSRDAAVPVLDGAELIDERQYGKPKVLIYRCIT